MDDRLQILIVEDEPVTRRAVIKAVRSAGDQVADMHEESDGHAALAALRRGTIDCAFLDYQLPGLDGLSVLKQARAEGIKTPIIILTAKGDEQLAVEMMKAGAADYLSKSRMSPEALWQSLRNAVRVHRAELRAAEATERLRENEERLSRVLETTLDGIIILDRDGRYLYFNPAAERIFGVGPMEITGLTLETAPWTRTRGDGTPLPFSEHTFNLVLASGRPVQGQEMGVVRQDGSRVVVSINAAPLTDPDGSISGVVASLRDVTDRKRAETLRETHNRVLRMLATDASLEDVLDALAQGVEEQLPGGFCGVLLKDAGAERLRWAAAPNVPRAYVSATPEAGVPILADAGSCGTAAFRRQRVICQDIATDPLWNRAGAAALAAGVRACWSQPILTANGEVLGTFAVFYDQTRAPLDHELHAVESAVGLAEIAIRRKRDEAALRETNQTLSTLIDNSPLPIIALDRERRLRTWNPAAERVFGFSAMEAIGRFPPYVPPEKVEEATAIVGRVLAGEVYTGTEVQRIRKDGSAVDVSLSAAPLLDGHGQISGVMAVLLDVTERNRLKEQLLQSQKMEAVGRLAGGIAHDFNNILAIISGYSESLTRKLEAGAPLHSNAMEINKAAERGAALTKQLLAFSRRQAVKPQKLDLNEVVEHVHGMLRRVISDRIAIDVKPARGLRLVEADVGQMEQVLINLSLNARDAMPEGGKITIRTANVEIKPPAARLAGLKPGAYVRLSVADTGQGMDDATRQRIFEPFFTTKETGKGTGLGLSIVYGIAQQCGGTVSVESEPGEGARFDVHIPAMSEAAHVVAAVVGAAD
jgi:PAS domain S-box-containing protein